MRLLLRWMIVLGVLVAAVWASASIEVRGRTPIGHALFWWKAQDFFAKTNKGEPKKQPRKKEALRPPASAPIAPVEKEATAKRVALLERAAQAIDRDDGNPGAKTVIGEKPSKTEQKALDELVSSRVPRRR